MDYSTYSNEEIAALDYQKRRKAPGFIHGDISRARRICVSN